MEKIHLSVIVPFYNEEGNLPILHKELMATLSGIDLNSQIIYVNDGSTDDSLGLLTSEIELDRNDKVKVEVVELEKNFGQTAAISAGIDQAKGELVSFLDADLQNDPVDIPRFLDKQSEGYDAVFGWRRERKDKTLRRILSRLANLTINKTFSYPYHDVGCSAKVVKKEFLKDLQLYGELHRVLPVLIYLSGAKVGELIVTHRGRKRGRSKYGYDRIIKTMIDIVTVKFLISYGTKPAYVFGTFGFGSIFLAALSLITVLYRKFFLGVFIHRDPLFLITVFLVIVGIQFILMGLIAELQVRTYFESQKKKIYKIKKTQSY